jgi:hypothetical protein
MNIYDPRYEGGINRRITVQSCQGKNRNISEK